MTPNGSLQGRHNGQPETPQLPFIQITVNPAMAAPGNPNGVQVGTNCIPGKGDMDVMMLLAEAQQQVILAIKNRKISSVVGPDGSPMVLPEAN
jgi:hypothetical protein